MARKKRIIKKTVTKTGKIDRRTKLAKETGFMLPIFEMFAELIIWTFSSLIKGLWTLLFTILPKLVWKCFSAFIFIFTRKKSGEKLLFK